MRGAGGEDPCMEMKVLAKDLFLGKTFSAEWVGESRVVNAAIESRCCLDVKKELARYGPVGPFWC